MIILFVVAVDKVILSKQFMTELNLITWIKVLQQRRTNRVAAFRCYAVTLSEK